MRDFLFKKKKKFCFLYNRQAAVMMELSLAGKQRAEHQAEHSVTPATTVFRWRAEKQRHLNSRM